MIHSDLYLSKIFHKWHVNLPECPSPSGIESSLLGFRCAERLGEMFESGGIHFTAMQELSLKHTCGTKYGNCWPGVLSCGVLFTGLCDAGDAVTAPASPSRMRTRRVVASQWPQICPQSEEDSSWKFRRSWPPSLSHWCDLPPLRVRSQMIRPHPYE